jgi:hypothetical protein
MFKKGDRVKHPSWGFGTAFEDSRIDSTLVEFDKNTDYGDIVEVSTSLLRHQTPIEEYEEMYCDTCGGTACHC